MNLYVFILILGTLCSICVLYLNGEESPVINYIFGSTDSDENLTTPEIIRSYGYPAETHIIETEDGYLLSYYRVPHGKIDNGSKKPYPIILHHGLFSCSADWIINGPERSLAYRLADEGYDVWLANARGTTESKAHVSLKPSEREFWNFTFHEMGKYDIPGAINYILGVTNKEKIMYIGHSQGTTVFYTFASTRPELSDKVLLHISLAPVAEIPHTATVFRNFVPLLKELRSTGEWYKKGPVMEYSSTAAAMGKFFCSKTIFNYNLCEQLLIFRITGRDEEQFHEDLFTIMLSKMPAGTSTKNVLHFGQIISPGTFTQFDYGKKQNLVMYNHTTPPRYDFSKIRVPVRLYYGDNDIVATPLDTQLLYQKLTKPMGCIRVPYDKWNHVDFLWAKDVNPLFNDELIQFLGNATDHFIERTVAAAIEERNKAPVPINVPFDEEVYKKVQANMAASSYVPTYLQEMIEYKMWAIV